MTGLLVSSLAMETAAAVTAILLASRRPDHRPAAGALVLLAAASLARVPLNAALSPHPVEPWQGVARVLVYLDGGAVLGAVAVTPGLALAVSVSPERRRVAVALVAAAWLLASLVLAALYPSPAVRGAGLQRVYLAAEEEASGVESELAFPELTGSRDTTPPPVTPTKPSRRY